MSGNSTTFADRAQAWWDDVHAIYAELGYPAEVIDQWSLPRSEAIALMAELDRLQPRSVLEIGTFVGFTTLLMARAAPNAHIHTVDPSLPMALEFGAMRSEGHGSDLSLRTQEVAARAARRLGLHNRVSLHAGGFSTGDSFVTAKADPRARVEVVGPRVCAEGGPFDFVFIDGLHYTDAVLSDLALVIAHLVPGGTIALHDVIGMWGANVRRALFAFLDANDDFVLTHDPYRGLYGGMAFLRHRPDARKREGPRQVVAAEDRVDTPELTAHLAALLVKLRAPQSVVQVEGAVHDLTRSLREFGVPEVVGVSRGESAPAEGVLPVGELAPDRRFAACVCLDALPRDIELCTRLSDWILLGFSPPGEAGVADDRDVPITRWVRAFLQRGYVFRDEVRPYLEPFSYPFASKPIYSPSSSHLLNLYVVERDPTLDTDAAQEPLKCLLSEKEARIEDLSVQMLAQGLALGRLREQLAELQQLSDVQHERLQAKRWKALPGLASLRGRLPRPRRHPVARADSTEMRFEFGRNWSEFASQNLSEARIETARFHLLRFLQLDDLKGRALLDIGCGSGIHSLAAFRSGAERIVSVDYDPDSVATTARLREYAGSPAHWTVMQGDVLDADFMAGLEPADIVYSWGVLHHTGAMWSALRNAAGRLRPDGMFYVALYTSEVFVDPTPEFWLRVKQRYNRAGVAGKRLLELWYLMRFTVLPEIRQRRNPLKTIRDYGRSRGMSYYTDVKDWLGGWPMEFSSIGEVKRFARDELDLSLLNLWAGEANTEYLFRPQAATNWWNRVLSAHPERSLDGPFRHQGGSCWVAELPELVGQADSSTAPARSTLQIFEDAQPLGFAHAPHQHIQALGRGRYSHWESRLLFSPSDDSDPNSNGRRYSIRLGLR